VKRHLIGAAAIVLGTALVGGVSVQTAAAVDAPTTVTLPMFGVPLTFEITTGPGGTLTDVSVDSATTVPTSARPHKVRFESANPDATGDPGKVTVKSRHGGQSVTARAGSLADITGAGSWGGDLFGNGTTSTVGFNIGAAADGTPDITDITTTGAPGVAGEVKHSSDTDHDGDSFASARVSVRFTDDASAQSRSVTVAVKVHTDEDGSTSAKLSISLSDVRGVAVDAAAAAGPHTWTDQLCDGSTATVTYVVATDGSVSDVVATPEAQVRTHGSKVDVRFSKSERVRIRVREDDGQIKISVDERIRCRDAEDPTVNGSVVPTTIDDDHEGDDHDHDGGRHGGGHDHGDDDTNTTATTGA
jgi:hypothetical protein